MRGRWTRRPFAGRCAASAGSADLSQRELAAAGHLAVGRRPAEAGGDLPVSRSSRGGRSGRASGSPLLDAGGRKLHRHGGGRRPGRRGPAVPRAPGHPARRRRWWDGEQPRTPAAAVHLRPRPRGCGTARRDAGRRRTTTSRSRATRRDRAAGRRAAAAGRAGRRGTTVRDRRRLAAGRGHACDCPPGCDRARRRVRRGPSTSRAARAAATCADRAATVAPCAAASCLPAAARPSPRSAPSPR